MYSRKILGVRVDFGLSMPETIKYIDENLLSAGGNKSHIICTTNPEFIVDAQGDRDFKDIINNSSLSVPDGVGVLFANKYLEGIKKYKKNLLFPIRSAIYGASLLVNNRDLGESITGVELTDKLCKLASEKGYSVGFVGGWPRNWKGKRLDIAEDYATKAATIMSRKYPGLKVACASSNFSWKEFDDVGILKYFKECLDKSDMTKIDILFVAFSHGNQEKWISRNSTRIPARISIGIGGTLDYINRHYKSVPPLFIKCNLSWLFRLITQPFRLSRVYKAFPLFPIKIYRQSQK